MSYFEDYQDEDLDYDDDDDVLAGDDIEDQDDYEAWRRYIDGND